MKKLSELKINEKALLTNGESSAKGTYVGSNTSYYGPSNPSSITTYEDGFLYGSDGVQGSLDGDSWYPPFAETNQQTAELYVTKD